MLLQKNKKSSKIFCNVFYVTLLWGLSDFLYFMRDFYFVLQIVILSDMAAKTAPTAHTPIQPSCVQANPAQYVPNEPPIK